MKGEEGERRRVFLGVTCRFDQASTQVPSVERVHPGKQESKERERVVGEIRSLRRTGTEEGGRRRWKINTWGQKKRQSSPTMHFPLRQETSFVPGRSEQSTPFPKRHPPQELEKERPTRGRTNERKTRQSQLSCSTLMFFCL